MISAVADTSSRIAVIYPDIGEPYRSVFAKMVQGIEERAKSSVATIPVGEKPNDPEIVKQLRQLQVRTVILLGRNSLKMASVLERDFHVVIGGVSSVPEADTKNLTISTLAPDPALLFAQLKLINPAVRRIFVVYDPSQNSWIVRLAKIAAVAKGLELLAFEAADIKIAMQHYQSILLVMESNKDALWLPIDSTTVHEASVLPTVLQEAWARNLTIFSSNVAHVRRGALFALYPNNLEVGKDLADYVLGQPAQGSALQRGIFPLKSVQVAVNVRTAKHLGIDFGHQLVSFNLVFPEK